MALIGYMRTSTDDQTEASQEDALNAAGCVRLYRDHGVSGRLASRPGWDACQERLEPGDTLVVTKLDRLGRSLINLVEIVNNLAERDVALKILDLGIDTGTNHGKLIYSIMGALAEWERNIIVERTRSGLAAARARGRVGGGKPKLSPAKARMAREMYDAKGEDGKRKYTVAQIAHVLGVTRATVYRQFERDAAKEDNGKTDPRQVRTPSMTS